MSIVNTLKHCIAYLRGELRFVIQLLLRNRVIKNDVDLGNGVMLFYYRLSKKSENLGDYLSKVVVSHFVPQPVQFGMNLRKRTIYAIGSIIGFRCQNAVIWGSGILSQDKIRKRNIKHSKLDIRAVRGPKTRELLCAWGKECPEIYGDPAILLPLIYSPGILEKKYSVSLIYNHEHRDFSIPQNLDVHEIDIVTTDYKTFIDQILQSELIISSSLHGIILAESYGVPAVLMLKQNALVFKFEDWYKSTGREDFIIARDIEEAISVNPMKLPDLTVMQKQLVDAFPIDLWSKEL